MTETGIVLKNRNNYSQVRIERNSACASCGKCGMSESQKHVDFYVENACNAQVGDVVELDIPDANVAPLAFVAYILPLIPALALMFVSMFALHLPDWASLLMFVGGLAVGFGVVAIIDRYRKHKWAQSPTMKSVVRTSVSQQAEQVGDGKADEQNDTTVQNDGTNNEAIQSETNEPKKDEELK